MVLTSPQLIDDRKQHTGRQLTYLPSPLAFPGISLLWPFFWPTVQPLVSRIPSETLWYLWRVLSIEDISEAHLDKVPDNFSVEEEEDCKINYCFGSSYVFLPGSTAAPLLWLRSLRLLLIYYLNSAILVLLTASTFLCALLTLKGSTHAQNASRVLDGFWKKISDYG